MFLRLGSLFLAAGIRDNAGRLGAQARALNDAGAALKEQTKSLVAAAADALKNRESEEAQQRLKGLGESSVTQMLFFLKKKKKHLK
jgi:hypothetical protein